jgi:ATP-binding cassette subfamily B protein
MKAPSLPRQTPPETWRKDFPDSTNPLRFFLYASKPHIKFAIPAIITVTVAQIMYSSIPYAFKLIANAAAQLPQRGAYEELLIASIFYLALLSCAQIIWRVSGFFGSYWAIGSRATAYNALTTYVTLHSRAYFSDRFAGSLGSKIRHAGHGMRDLVEIFLWQFLQFAVSIVASFVLAFFASAIFAWIFLGWVVVVGVFNYYFAKKRIPLAAETQRMETALNGATVDLLSNISAMQEYARRPFEIERLRRAIDRRRVTGLYNWHYGEWVLLSNVIIQVIFGGLMILVALRLAQAGTISAGDIVLILSIIFTIERSLLDLGSQLNRFGEIWGEIGESLTEILEPHEIPDRADAGELTVQKGAIDIEDMSFSYSGYAVFKKLNLHIKPGERVGLVGRSGAGKSTLMRLLLHHHDIQGGAIKVDGVDVSSVTQESLRSEIAVVPQEPLLFHRTISENIAYGNPGASQEDVERAAKQAQAHDFILRLKEGYKSLVGERGIKLSGGERQRVAIARAILKDAPILLLDEATAALDSESEVAIQQALSELMKGKTVIAIAHRLSTLREMDRILVMDRGAIAEEGKHQELLKKKGLYAELWAHQAGGFIGDE